MRPLAMMSWGLLMRNWSVVGKGKGKGKGMGSPENKDPWKSDSIN